MAKNPWTGKGRPGDRKKARRKRGLFNFNYEPKTQIPREINIKNIKVGEGRRALNSGKVKELVQSIDALDLQTPITVRPVSFTRGWKDPDYALVSGLHRLEAMKQLNRPTIVAFVMRDGKEMARMWEISGEFTSRRADASGAIGASCRMGSPCSAGGTQFLFKLNRKRVEVVLSAASRKQRALCSLKAIRPQPSVPKSTAQ